MARLCASTERACASMGPPPKEGGRQPLAATIDQALDLLLQWGHPRKRVEGLDERGARVAAQPASMGPPPKEGGRLHWPPPRTRPARFNGATPERGWKGCGPTGRGCAAPDRRLQWGHPRKRVEGGRRRSPGSRCASFNGATPERGWKVGQRQRDHVGHPPLQWGHPRKRVEGLRRAAKRPCDGLASMGPPPKEGGRLRPAHRPRQAPRASMGPPPKEGGRPQHEGQQLTAGHLQLQWGHPRKRVEGLVLAELASLMVSQLQWGHPRKRVEGRNAGGRRRQQHASMGPPPKEGGRVRPS